MPIRRSHRKSRNGCIECKRRRVKCNEGQPCHNCLKYQSDCIYQTELGQHHGRPIFPTASNSQTTDQTASTSVIGAVESFAGPSPCRLARTADFEAQDLELMHHFSTAVAKTISHRSEIQDAWAIALPKEAYSCDYLMHGLLALSALHLDLTSREKRHDYAGLSTYHLHKSLARFRERLANISIENCVPLFGLSSLMVIHTCAQPSMERDSALVRENSTSKIEMLMKIFNLCRGVETVLAPYRDKIHESPLRSFLHEDYRLVGDSKSCDNTIQALIEESQFSDLANLIKIQNFESEEQNEYLDALQKLETAFRFMRVASQPLEPGAAFVWPILLQRNSIHLFMRLTPLSLVLLAHYCIILHHLDGYWFLHGWYKALLDEIIEILPSELKIWVLWPRKVCGLVDLSETS